MEDRDLLAEAGAEAADRLRRQADLRDEHDRAHPPLQRGIARLEVHLGLAASGRAVQKQIGAEPLVHRADDPSHGRLLRLAERRRFGLAAQRLADGGLRPLGAARALDRRDELERPGRGRAVVPRDPERELDERRRHLIHDPLDRGRVDPLGRSGPHLDDDAAPPGVAETHLDDRPRPDVVRHLVRERARDRAGGHQRVNGGKRHPSETSGEAKLDPGGLQHQLGAEAEHQPGEDHPGDEHRVAEPLHHLHELDDDVEDRAGRRARGRRPTAPRSSKPGPRACRRRSGRRRSGRGARGTSSSAARRTAARRCRSPRSRCGGRSR